MESTSRRDEACVYVDHLLILMTRKDIEILDGLSPNSPCIFSELASLRLQYTDTIK
jgi:hypothetical protein